jgi:tripartite ATP-independent transporter DctM subunit
MNTQYVPLFMFISLFVALFAGIPISFAIAFVSITFSFFLWGAGSMSLLVSAAFGTMNNFTLIAIPLFIFMAIMLEKSDVVKDLYQSIYKWSGGLRGGLAVATIIVGAIIGAVSGVVAAGVIGLGVIALPQMLGYKYDRKISMGSILAGGTLGQMIPPSLNMVVYGAITGVSVGKLFAGGLSVGVFMALMFSLYVLVISYFRKDLCPAIPKENRATWKEKIISLRVIVFPMILILAVLGSILSGAATPTEGAGIGAFGAVLFSLISGRFKFRILREVSIQTFKVTVMVIWIIFAAATFSSVFSGVGGNRMIQEIAASMPGGRWGVLSLIIIFIVFLGMFLENIAIIMLAAPIVSPLLVLNGFDPLWWGLVFMTLLQIAYLSPPFGLSLFYLKGVTPDNIKIEDIYASSIPFIGIQLLCVVILIAFPAIAVWLPNILVR